MRLKYYRKLHLFILGLAVLLTLPSALLSAAEPKMTMEMFTLIRQADNLYSGPFGAPINKLVNSDPKTFAVFLGATLQRQGNYSDANPQYIDHYWVLRNQCTDLFKEVASNMGDKNPKDGSPMTYEMLLEEFNNAITGKYNSAFINSYGINPAIIDAPMILAQVPVQKSQEAVTPSAKLHRKKNEIKLFQEVSPSAKNSDDGPYNKKNNYTKNRTIQVQDKYGDAWVEDPICPDINTSSESLSYDAKSPNNVAYVTCSYYRDGRLASQSSQKHVMGDNHGMYYLYQTEDGVYYLERSRTYVHGKQQGEEIHYALSKQKQPYIGSNPIKVEKRPLKKW